MSEYVFAEGDNKNNVIYTDRDGKRYCFSGGTRTWRNHNPGNLISGKVSKRNNSIGKAGGFAVFPSYELGHNALVDCLKNEYGNATIPSLVKKYAPEVENDVKRYTKFLLNKTGVGIKKKVGDFTVEEFGKLWKAIEQIEGWKEGKIKEVPPIKEIIKVRKDQKGIITSYYVQGMGWISKIRGIILAKKGVINAVVAKSRSGNMFSRTRPDLKLDNNFDRLG